MKRLALRRWVGLVGLLLATMLTAYAGAQDTSGALSPTRLKLPRGPGSLEGVGENAEAQLNQGQVSYGVAFSLPAGQQGLTPGLGLRYSSSGGASVVGLGWSLGGVGCIERMTSRGLPVYGTGDLFATESGAELARVTGGSGGNYIYRERFEGSFTRYTWMEATTGAGTSGYWKAETADGRVSYYGARANGAVVPSARLLGTNGGVFGYYLSETVDPFGHRITYDYVLDGGRPLLTQVSWGFDGSTPRYTASLEYETRPDVLTDAKPGAVVRLTQRLVGVRIRVSGQQLRRYGLTYEATSASAGLSRLAAVRTFGTDDTAMNPIVFSFVYSRGLDLTCAMSSATCPHPYRRTVGSVGVDFRSGDADFIDMNGDAFPDVLDTTSGVHTIHLQNVSNTMMPSFLAPVVSTMVGSGSAMLSNPEVKLVDLDGDGRSDLIDGANSRVIRNGGSTGDWRAAELLDTNLPTMALDGDLRFLDVDYDRQIDLVHLEASGAWYVRNLGYGIYAAAATPVNGLGRGFTTDGLLLADMNGDGMPDVVQFQPPGDLWYFPNLGYGEFGPAEVMNGVPVGWTAADTDLVDISGDGLTDLVRVLGNTVQFVINRDSTSLSTLTTLSGSQVEGDLPERLADTSVRYVDMNANGTTDVVYVSASGLVEYVELYAERPNLLVRVNNGIGKRIDIAYGTIAEHMARDGGAGAASGWAHTLPHPMIVLDSVTLTDTRTLTPQVQRFEYRSGFWDPQEHQFRGFEDVRVATPGDEHVETGGARHKFDVGVLDRYHRGLPLSVEMRSNDRVLTIATSEWADCTVAQASPVGGALPVRYICSQRQTTNVVEGLSTIEAVQTQENSEYDGYGNRTAHHSLGVVSRGQGECAACARDTNVVQGEPCGPSCIGDERHELTDYIVPGVATGGRWMLHKPYRSRTFGVEGVSEIGEERTYYDGVDFAGLALGSVTLGSVHRVEQRRLAGVDTWRPSERFATNAHGNVTSLMDANGHRRVLAYDSAGLLLKHEQIEFDDPDHPPYGLRMEVEYHPVHEQIVNSSGWMLVVGGSVASAQRLSAYAYDSFGRVVAITEPGDSPSTPTQEFSYELADPVSRIVTRRRTTSGSAVAALESVQCLDGLGRAYQERVRLATGAYQVGGSKTFGAHGQAWRLYQAYRGTTGACDIEIPANSEIATESNFDAANRKLQTIHSDAVEQGGMATIERTIYMPFAVESWDGEDADNASIHTGTPTTERYDGLGRVLQQERLLAGDPNPVTTRLTYDSNGRVRSLVDAAGNEQWQLYDLLGRNIQVHHPDSGLTTYEYDDADRLLRRTDARSVAVDYRYDEANRVREVWDPADPGGTRVSYLYDSGCDSGIGPCANGEGALVQIRYPLLDAEQGVDVIDRDERGRETSRTVVRGSRRYQFARGYDAADRNIARSYPDGTLVEFILDGLGRVTSVPGYISNVEFDARGNVSGRILANGVSTRTSFDTRARLKALTTILPSGADGQSYEYSWDRVGNLVSISDSRDVEPGTLSENARYTYDSLYRLTGASLDAGRVHEEDIAYVFDRIDNVTRIASSLGERSSIHVGDLRYGEEENGPHVVTHVGGERYGYDQSGQNTTRYNISQEWDFQGRLVRATRPDLQGDIALRVAYGTDWNRVQQASPGHASEFVVDDFEIRDGIATVYIRLGGSGIARIERTTTMAMEMTDLAPARSVGDGTLVSEPNGLVNAADAWLFYVQRAGTFQIDGPTRSGPQSNTEVMLTAAAHRVLIGADGGDVTYEHTDHLGTVTCETDEHGEVTRRMLTYPYGTMRYEEGTGASRHGYSGADRSASIGLVLSGARWLDSRSGRWASPDPAFRALEAPSEGESLDWVSTANPATYSYANPTTYRDPSGLQPSPHSNCPAGGCPSSWQDRLRTTGRDIVGMVREGLATEGMSVADDAASWALRSVRASRFFQGIERRLGGLLDQATAPVRRAFLNAVGDALADSLDTGTVLGRQVFRYVRGPIARMSLDPHARSEAMELVLRLINRIDSSWSATRMPVANATRLWKGEARPFGLAVDSAGRMFKIENIANGGTVNRAGEFVLDYSRWEQIR